MTDIYTLIAVLAGLSCETAHLFCRTAWEDCHACVTEISDLNRRALSELAEGERTLLYQGSIGDKAGLPVAYAVASTVTKGFSASLLLPASLPHLPPLQQEVQGIAELASCLVRFSSFSGEGKLPFYSMHLCANKGRGAHALLLTNYCAGEGGRWLLPLAQALEAWRDSLERVCVETVAMRGKGAFSYS